MIDLQRLKESIESQKGWRADVYEHTPGVIFYSYWPGTGFVIKGAWEPAKGEDPALCFAMLDLLDKHLCTTVHGGLGGFSVGVLRCHMSRHDVWVKDAPTRTAAVAEALILAGAAGLLKTQGADK